MEEEWIGKHKPVSIHLGKWKVDEVELDKWEYKGANMLIVKKVKPYLYCARHEPGTNGVCPNCGVKTNE